MVVRNQKIVLDTAFIIQYNIIMKKVKFRLQEDLTVTFPPHWSEEEMDIWVAKWKKYNNKLHQETVLTTDEVAKLDEYGKFVESTTSKESLDTLSFIDRLYTLNDWFPETEFSQLLTASIGMQAESGEFSEIIKKIIFQGKAFTKEERFHLMRELGDVLWYWVQGCKALGYTPQQVMEENIKKLESRYPNGFEVVRSEVRAKGDI